MLKFLIGLAAIIVLLIAVWFRVVDFWSEASLIGDNVVVALTADPALGRVLLSTCDFSGAIAEDAVLPSDKLARLPNGTEVILVSNWSSAAIMAVTVREGELRGKTVWVCRSNLSLTHTPP